MTEITDLEKIKSEINAILDKHPDVKGVALLVIKDDLELGREQSISSNLFSINLKRIFVSKVMLKFVLSHIEDIQALQDECERNDNK